VPKTLSVNNFMQFYFLRSVVLFGFALLKFYMKEVSTKLVYVDVYTGFKKATLTFELFQACL